MLDNIFFWDFYSQISLKNKTKTTSEEVSAKFEIIFMYIVNN